MWVLGFTNFAVTFSYAPRSTALEFTWLVGPGLEAGKDYDIEKICYAWRVTTPQDQKIVENNQAGIESL